MRGYLWRGVRQQRYLNCVAGSLSFPDVCRSYWCLLFSTAGRHGKNPKTENEVKGKQHGEGILVFNESLRIFGFCFLMRIKARRLKMEIIIWSEKQTLSAHSKSSSKSLSAAQLGYQLDSSTSCVLSPGKCIIWGKSMLIIKACHREKSLLPDRRPAIGKPQFPYSATVTTPCCVFLQTKVIWLCFCVPSHWNLTTDI